MWLALACVEQPSPKGGPDPDPTTPPAVEVCNGVDDDGDATVDEGFLDIDGDTVADCVDDACEPVVTPAPVEVAACASWWDVGVRVVPLGLDPDAGLFAAPLVDHDGDGALTGADGATLVAVSSAGLVAVDAVTGAVELDLGLRGPGNGLALVDVDGVPGPEIVYGYQILDTADPDFGDYVVRAVDRSGAELWASEPYNFGVTYGGWCFLTAADLDGDGVPDVTCDNVLFDGGTGAWVGAIDTPLKMPEGTHLLADLEQDGVGEVLMSGAVFDPTGAVVWSAGFDTSDPYADHDTQPATAQLDADPEAEVLWVHTGALHVFEHDGQPIGVWPTGDSGGGSPCVADFDGDGASEVVFGTYDHVFLFEADGTVGWSVAEPGNSTSCAAFDFDDDGASEVVIRLAADLVILDGRTGALRYADRLGVTEDDETLPLVLDVDGDGHAEVVVGDGDEARIYANTRWAGAGPAWGAFDYSEGRIDADGVATLAPTWLDAGFHARAVTGPADPPAPGFDLAVTWVGGCTASCDALQVVVLQVDNRGDAAAPAGVSVALSADGVVVAEQALPELASGASVEVSFEVDPSPGAWEVTVAGAGDCRSGNDQVTVYDQECP